MKAVSFRRMGNALEQIVEDDLRIFALMMLICMVTTLFPIAMLNDYTEIPPYVNEELWKHLFATISAAFGWTFGIVFSSLEFGSYISDHYETFEMAGEGWIFICIRLFCLSQHLLWMWIHIYSIKKGRQASSLSSNIRWRFNGLLICMFLHWFHNNVVADLIVDYIL
jgi:hypothetical protein